MKERLFPLADEKYRAFSAALVPNVEPRRVIGVRVPALKALAKELRGTAEAAEFMERLPHEYLEENHLHGFLINDIKPLAACVAALDAFLPHVDNWATCDGISPVCFKRSLSELYPHVLRWLGSPHEYAVRFGIKTLMGFYLRDGFAPEHFSLVADIKREEYYIRMMQAWYFATALAIRPEETFAFLESRTLDKWTHNKAIQKAVESYRVSPEMKTRLREIKIK